VDTKLARKFCLTIWLYGSVPHKEIMFQIDCLSRKGRKARKEKLLNPALRALHPLRAGFRRLFLR
jgi:hypothetical protein